MLNPFDFSDALDSMTVVVDTREQPTSQARKRYQAIGVPIERRKLDFGDYSAFFKAGDTVLDLSDKAVIERKMNLDELAMCFTSQRGRFEREFERIKASGAKCYLLVENASWEKVYNGKYRSKMHPNAMIASILAFSARYNAVPIFCTPEMSGKLIHDILYREGKERLEVIMDDERISGEGSQDDQGNGGRDG